MYLAAREEPGVTSRLRKFGSTRDFWDLPCGGRLPFPVVLDVQKIDPAARTLKWRIEALVGLVDNVPKLNGVCVTSADGIDPNHLQLFFRWRSPIDVVALMVPELVRAGQDPFDYDYPIDGFPDAANLERTNLTRLTDEFLEDIAEQYRRLGRGYAAKIAHQKGVSRRTVVSWIEKARSRGIIGKALKGSWGEYDP